MIVVASIHFVHADVGESLVVNPINNLLYVSLHNYTLGINGSSGVIVNNISAIGELSVDTAGHKLYVSHGNVTVVDLDTSNKSVIAMPNYGFALDSNPNTHMLYLVDDESMMGFAALNETNNVAKGYNTSEIIAYNIAVNPSTNKVYLLDNEKNKLHVFDPLQNRIISNISIMNDASDIVLNPKTNRIYISNIDGSRIAIMNGSENRIVGYIFTGINEAGTSNNRLTINPETNTIYVADSSAKQVIIINGTTNRVEKNISTGITPAFISVNTHSGDVFILDDTSERIARISNDSKLIPLFGYNVIDNKQNKDLNGITISKFASDMVISPETSMIYVLSPESNTIYSIDSSANKIIGKITLSQKPSHIKILSRLNQLIYSYENKPNLYSLSSDYNGTLQQYKMPQLSALDVDPTTDKIYAVTDTESNGFRSMGLNSTLYIFSPNNPTSPDLLNTSTSFINNMAINPKSGKLYFSGDFSFEILDIPLNISKILDAKSIVNPRKIALDTMRNVVYVLGNRPTKDDFVDYSDNPNTLYVIDGSTDLILRTQSFDANLNDLKVNENTGTVYISATALSSKTGETGVVFAVNGSGKSDVTDIVVGKNPNSLAVDTNKNLLYVLDPSLGSIYLINLITNHPVPARSTVDYETNPQNSGDIFCNGIKVNDLSVNYGYNTRVYCEAKAYHAFQFDSWIGNIKASSTNASFSVNADQKVIANFHELPHSLTLTDLIIIVSAILVAIPSVIYITNLIKKRKINP